jgi:beta-glucosidase
MSNKRVMDACRVIVAGVVACGIANAATLEYQDPALSVERRVADLLGRMTLDEKVMQLRGLGAPLKKLIATTGELDLAQADAVLALGVGELGPIREAPSREVASRNAIQKYLREKTRLGIPAIFHDEGCHGLLAPQATSFPIPIGLACSWDPELTERLYTVVAREMRARGIHHALTPVVDVCREPRWGRTDETLGEDPYLNGKLGAAMVRGLQGSATGEIRPEHVAATLKHLVGHGQPQGGRNTAPAEVAPRELRDIHLLPFRIAIAESRPATIMPSYNEVDAVPSHANAWLLQDLVRGEYKYDGLLVSDYDGIDMLWKCHKLAADPVAATALAFRSGVEMDFPEGVNFLHLKALVEAGTVPLSLVDAAVARVLRLKFALGLFENPFASAQQAEDMPKRSEARQLALEAARKSIVLLKNDKGILPLAPGRYKRIAVIGPNADQARLGSYSGEPLYQVTLLDGIRKRAGTACEVVHATGCLIVTNLPPSSFAAWWGLNDMKFPDAAQNRADIAAAVAVAKTADLVILALGENEAIAREAWATCHKGDRVGLELFGAQNELARAMFSLGKPVVVYLMNGKPLAIPEISDKADAILEGWYLGQETGTAAAEVLFGDVNPSGKLTITFPRSTGQLPVYYNHKPSAFRYGYVDESSRPLFPFGFGLSYTTFDYSAPRLAPSAMTVDGTAKVAVTVTNTGKVAGDEIVQLYIRDRVSSVTRPVKELRGFQRVSLKPGESRDVEFLITGDALAFHGREMKWTVEPGEFEVMTGRSSEDVKSTVLVVKARTL